MTTSISRRALMAGIAANACAIAAFAVDFVVKNNPV